MGTETLPIPKSPPPTTDSSRRVSPPRRAKKAESKEILSRRASPARSAKKKEIDEAPPVAKLRRGRSKKPQHRSKKPQQKQGDSGTNPSIEREAGTETVNTLPIDGGDKPQSDDEAVNQKSSEPIIGKEAPPPTVNTCLLYTSPSPRD